MTALVFNPDLVEEYAVLLDQKRHREIPIQIHYPPEASGCSDESPCSVAFLSSGYGVRYNEYSFISHVLNEAGYLVVAIQHELPGDPPLAITGDLRVERSENWRRGASTLDFIREELKSVFTDYDFDRLTLVGHSNGGDISAWAINHGADYAHQLITLDHRRVPLPRADSVSVLSIRGSDFSADEGVLYTPAESKQLDACMVPVAHSKHNDMTDMGPDWLKEAITNIIAEFLIGRCRGS